MFWITDHQIDPPPDVSGSFQTLRKRPGKGRGFSFPHSESPNSPSHTSQSSRPRWKF